MPDPTTARRERIAEPVHIISLGAGVQSSTMALMAAHGEITPMPDGAIFADTQAESQQVYDWLDQLQEQLPFQVFRVSAGNLYQDSVDGINSSGDTFTAVPWHMERGLGARQCTKQYKIAPIYKQMRGLGARAASLWLGISTDEAHRMKPARVKWVTNRWPLVELRKSRSDCLAWLQRHGFSTPPKSACVFCPYASDAFLKQVKEKDAPGWAKAVAVDEAIRSTGRKWFVHKSRIPLRDVDLRDASDGTADLFGNECEGMCGV